MPKRQNFSFGRPFIVALAECEAALPHSGESDNLDVRKRKDGVSCRFAGVKTVTVDIEIIVIIVRIVENGKNTIGLYCTEWILHMT